jgi:hypothetical protein
VRGLFYCLLVALTWIFSTFNLFVVVQMCVGFVPGAFGFDVSQYLTW